MNRLIKNVSIFISVLIVLIASLIVIFVFHQSRANRLEKRNLKKKNEVQKKIFYRKEFDEQYSNIIQYLKKTDIIDVDRFEDRNKESLKRNNIENLRDIIHILLVLELKRDKNINLNQDKIDLINNIGKILTSEEKDLHRAIQNVLSEQNSKNLKDCEEFLENINYFLNDERFKNIPNTFEGVDRSIENTKQGSEEHKYKIKKEDGFLSIYTEYFYDENHPFSPNRPLSWYLRDKIQIKKILKPGLEKNFSESKYVNLHHKKSLDVHNSNFSSEIYHSEISKILFPENSYKVRKFGDNNFVVFKLNESLRNIKKNDDISSLKIDKQSMFDSMGLALFLSLDDRSWRNYMIDENNKMMNIDFEIFVKSNDFRLRPIDNFKDFLEMSKDIKLNKDEMIKILLNHIYPEAAKSIHGEMKKTKELYENFFNNVTQSEVDQYRDNFLKRFTKENIEKINEINKVYVKTLNEERSESEYLPKENEILSSNIKYIDSLMTGKNSENSVEK